jgi:DNA transformation protein
MTNELTALPNIGKTLAERLEQADIHSYDDLAAIGSIEAVLRIKEANLDACYNMLYALEGAIQGVRWHAIPKEERAQLKAEFDQVRLN